MAKKYTLPESEIQKQILNWLTLKDVFHWRQNTGGMTKSYTTKAGLNKKYFVKFGRPGISDILGCYGGRFFAIEVKRKGGLMSDDQKAFQKDLVKAGGIGIVCFSFDEFLNDWNTWTKK